MWHLNGTSSNTLIKHYINIKRLNTRTMLSYQTTSLQVSQQGKWQQQLTQEEALIKWVQLLILQMLILIILCILNINSINQKWIENYFNRLTWQTMISLGPIIQDLVFTTLKNRDKSFITRPVWIQFSNQKFQIVNKNQLRMLTLVPEIMQQQFL